MKYQDYLVKRKTILKGCSNKRVVKRHSKAGEPRLCALCGQSLTLYQSHTGTYLTTVKHYHYKYLNYLNGSLCFNPKTCYQHLTNQGRK